MNQTLDPAAFVKAIDRDDDVTPPLTLPTNLTSYQVNHLFSRFNQNNRLEIKYL